NWFSGGRGTRRLAPAPRLTGRPRLESLEGRVAPAQFDAFRPVEPPATVSIIAIHSTTPTSTDGRMLNFSNTAAEQGAVPAPQANRAPIYMAPIYMRFPATFVEPGLGV